MDLALYEMKVEMRRNLRLWENGAKEFAPKTLTNVLLYNVIISYTNTLLKLGRCHVNVWSVNLFDDSKMQVTIQNSSNPIVWFTA